MTFDDETLVAYVDGELDLITANRIEKAMVSDEGLSKRIAAEKRLRERVHSAFAPIAEDGVPETLSAPLKKLDTQLLARNEMPQRSSWKGSAWGAMAACLVIGLSLGWALFSESNQGWIGQQNGQIIAQGQLEQSLEMRLAADNSPQSDIRIGLTFRNQAGEICRSFSGEQLSGIACKESNAWQLRWTESAGPSQEFRQANSSTLNSIIDDMLIGSPADQAEEERLRNSGWAE